MELPLESHDGHNPSFTTNSALLEFGQWNWGAVSLPVSRHHRQAAPRNWPFLARPAAGLWDLYLAYPTLQSIFFSSWLSLMSHIHFPSHFKLNVLSLHSFPSSPGQNALPVHNPSTAWTSKSLFSLNTRLGSPWPARAWLWIFMWITRCKVSWFQTRSLPCTAATVGMSNLLSIHSSCSYLSIVLLKNSSPPHR